MLFVRQPVERQLPTNEIHIWLASLYQPESLFRSLLSIEERIRAERFHFEEHRRRFTVRRGILRTILGDYYLGVEPSRLQFCYGKNGKPALADTFSREKIRFNLSHSEEFAVYAFARGCEIGVDIEQIRDIPEMEQIAEGFFSASEKAVFRALPESKKKEAFFNCWIRKEAFIKATGDGLSLPLDAFDVSLIFDEPARLLRIQEDSAVASGWSIMELQPYSGYVATLACEGQNFQLKSFDWPASLCI